MMGILRTRSMCFALVERRKLVRTSRTPGCTRQINLFAVKLADGRELRLDVDRGPHARRAGYEHIAHALDHLSGGVVKHFQVGHGADDTDPAL